MIEFPLALDYFCELARENFDLAVPSFVRLVLGGIRAQMLSGARVVRT